MTRDNLDLPVPPLRDLTALVYRYPVKEPVMTSFGAMHNRPAVFVRAEAEDGTVGWGEIWCNFPSVGAEHRARLVNQLLRPLLIGREFASPATAFQSISARTAVLALQCAEPGPFAQAIAGIDTALWDLVARRAQEPLWHLMGGIAPRIPVYASGINPTAPATRVAALLGAGHRAFKLKIGFGGEGDRQNLAAIRATIGRELTLATDANQAWSLEQALAELPHLAGFALAWLEEPIRADRPWSKE